MFPKPTALFQVNPTTVFIPNELVNCTNLSVGNSSNYWQFGEDVYKRQELDKAMAAGVKKLIFIHGVGNGRLKLEIQNILKSTKGVTFQDASYKDYGFGATQVNIL